MHEEFKIIEGIKHHCLYNTKGKIDLITPLNEKGERHGIQKEYNYDGSLFRETPYKNGKVDGIMNYYNKEKNIVERCLYENDKEIKELLKQKPKAKTKEKPKNLGLGR